MSTREKIDIDHRIKNEIDNTVWELLERGLLDNVDPKNAQYPSWWRHCDLVDIFEYGICDAVKFHIG